jgi:hypothetical protein
MESKFIASSSAQDTEAHIAGYRFGKNMQIRIQIVKRPSRILVVIVEKNDPGLSAP